MLQKELNAENKAIMNRAYELYEEHGFQDGHAFVDWLEAEKQTKTKQAPKHKTEPNKAQTSSMALGIIAMLCVIVLILLYMLFMQSPRVELAAQATPDARVMVLVLDSTPDEKVLVFGDTHFDFNAFTLSPKARSLPDKDVQLLNENPDTDIRMAGYTSGQGSEESNQELSEFRANAVRDYLIKKGIAAERITTIGYGRTKPALYEVSPGNIDTKEAKANMRVLFEIVVK